MANFRLGGAVLVALVTLAGCKDEAGAEDPLSVLGSGRDWRVTEIAGQPVPEGVTVILSQPEPGLVAGVSGCNRYNGRVTAQDGKLRFGALAGTRMMCPPEAMTVETAFHSVLPRVDGAQLADGRLELLSGGATVLIAQP